MQSTPSLCVALNGPPGIGKDTLALALVSLFHFDAVDAVANEIKRQAGDYFQIPDLPKLATDRGTKDCVYSNSGYTPRQLVWSYSKLLQKKFGKEVFMHDMLMRHSEAKTFMMTDLGLDPELPVLEKKFDRVIVVQLMHQEFGFSNDIRKFVFPKDKNNLIQLTTTRGDIDGDVQRILSALRGRLL
ncbi:hypothetical protein HOR75_gp26 [Shewanella phage SppYZU05]|uniref:Uncharacterized protein n=1 Tax=Shewanella phage SppYZU05 TaxID=1970795 RepID=A0A1W6JTF6_9CAUD|nr:hypothetical protein HOR75_gp26 [Shewanella phage SppYZU05]ARM70552.1 hypothetical protein SppYZU05_26 [Shewanella phage SppYZU05]